MPSYVFPDEVHNEDAHYSRLAIGFLQSSDERQIPLRFTDPELEAILLSHKLGIFTCHFSVLDA